MRDLISTAFICCFVTFIFFDLVLNTHVRAEQRSAPWDSVGCNDACRWWMNLGGKPAAEIKPTPAVQSPALSIKAIVSDADLAAAASPRLGAAVIKGLAADDRTSSIRTPARAPARGMLPPERPAYISGQSLWNVRIDGSSPVLPAALLTSP